MMLAPPLADFVTTVEYTDPKDCPYCQAFPAVPCALHHESGAGDG